MRSFGPSVMLHLGIMRWRSQQDVVVVEEMMGGCELEIYESSTSSLILMKSGEIKIQCVYNTVVGLQ